ncbi:DUF488 family protein, N3 subclade [Arthrobacter pullicola]|uniref:DUF488 family protein, N3 subclade n=1 Tax=Arthrobacter pullicola TaxID=2762224 RepID=UPI00384D37A9
MDRLWPRGVSKERARLVDWLKDVAPSTGCAGGSGTGRSPGTGLPSGICRMWRNPVVGSFTAQCRSRPGRVCMQSSTGRRGIGVMHKLGPPRLRLSGLTKSVPYGPSRGVCPCASRRHPT